MNWHQLQSVTLIFAGTALIWAGYLSHRRSQEQAALQDAVETCKQEAEEQRSELERNLRDCEEMSQEFETHARLCSGEAQWEYCPGFCDDVLEGVQPLEESYGECTVLLGLCERNYADRTHAAAVMDGVAHDCAADIEQGVEECMRQLATCREKRTGP